MKERGHQVDYPPGYIVSLPQTQYVGFRDFVRQYLASQNMVIVTDYCPCDTCIHRDIIGLISQGKLKVSPELFKSVTRLSFKRELIEAVLNKVVEEA